MSRLEIIADKMEGDICYRGCQKMDFLEVYSIYRHLNLKSMGVFNSALLFLFGRRNCLVATAGGSVIGVEIFYFGRRDFDENTIHEGFVGVLETFQGRGIATRMRSISVAHFSQFSGISTRISPTNSKSLNSAKRCGFVEVNRYVESNGDEHLYLVKPMEAVEKSRALRMGIW